MAFRECHIVWNNPCLIWAICAGAPPPSGLDQPQMCTLITRQQPKHQLYFRWNQDRSHFFSVSSNQLLCSRSIYKEELIYFHRSYAPYEERSLYLKASFHSWHWIINTWNTIKANWQEQTQHYLRWSSLSTISKIMKILPVVFFSPFLQICHFIVRVRLSCSG